MRGIGRHDDAEWPLAAPGRSQNVETAHVRQLYIEKHQVRTQLVDRLDRRRPGTSLSDHMKIIAAPAQLTQRGTRLRLLIDDQQLHCPHPTVGAAVRGLNTRPSREGPRS